MSSGKSILLSLWLTGSKTCSTPIITEAYVNRIRVFSLRRETAVKSAVISFSSFPGLFDPHVLPQFPRQDFFNMGLAFSNAQILQYEI
jgi:hypothetical protein